MSLLLCVSSFVCVFCPKVFKGFGCFFHFRGFPLREAWISVFCFRLLFRMLPLRLRSAPPYFPIPLPKSFPWPSRVFPFETGLEVCTGVGLCMCTLNRLVVRFAYALPTFLFYKGVYARTYGMRDFLCVLYAIR